MLKGEGSHRDTRAMWQGAVQPNRIGSKLSPKDVNSYALDYRAT